MDGDGGACLGIGTVGVSAWMISGADDDLAKAGAAGAREAEAGCSRGELGAVGELPPGFDFRVGPQNQSTISLAQTIDVPSSMVLHPF